MSHKIVLTKVQEVEKEMENFFSRFIYFILFIYFWLCWVFVAAHRLSSSYSEPGLLFVVVRGLLIAVVSLVVEHGF